MSGSVWAVKGVNSGGSVLCQGMKRIRQPSATTRTASATSFSGGLTRTGRSESPNGVNPLSIVGVDAVLVVEGTPDQRLAMVADAQQGRISREQLIAIGFTDAMIKARLRSGALRRIHQGVYAVGHMVETPYGDEVAALLACGERAVLSHLTAAFIWEMVPARANPVHVTMARTSGTRSRPGIRIHRSVSMTRADIKRRHGLPVTTPERALLDLADGYEQRLVERAFDEALARRLISPTKIAALLARSRGRRGAALLAALADPGRAAGVTREAAEERMLGIIRASGLPDPERNVAIGPYTVDMLWAGAGVVVEVDSFKWHSGPAAFKRDRRKDAFLAGKSLLVQRVTWEMMDEPLPLVARLARAIGA